MGLRIIEQRISANGNFNGTLPPGAAIQSKDFEKKFPAAATGGLFDFGLDSPAWLESFEFHAEAACTTWKVVKVDADAMELVLWKGTVETDFVIKWSDRVLLTDGQKIKVVTTGGAAALVARAAITSR